VKHLERHRQKHPNQNPLCNSNHDPHFRIMTATPRNIKRRRRDRVRFPGICRHAKLLGVHRIHLYLVLSGNRTGHSLLRRYKALVATETAA
jgi:hypothetical protein